MRLHIYPYDQLGKMLPGVQVQDVGGGTACRLRKALGTLGWLNSQGGLLSMLSVHPSWIGTQHQSPGRPGLLRARSSDFTCCRIALTPLKELEESGAMKKKNS